MVFRDIFDFGPTKIDLLGVFLFFSGLLGELRNNEVMQ